MPWVGAEPETVSNFMVGLPQSLRLSQYPWSQRRTRRPTSVRTMAWVGAEPATVHELVVAVVAEREALLKFLVKSLRSLTLSQSSW